MNAHPSGPPAAGAAFVAATAMMSLLTSAGTTIFSAGTCPSSSA